MKNYRRNNYIGKMKKGFKQKLSLLMIACLLFTGYRGLTISGRADSSHTEQNNEIEVSGTQVKVQLLGADLRRAATEAILKGEKVGKSNLRSYSKDQELATEFEEYFDGEKEIYNIPLNSIAENLEESLNAEEAGLQIYVERDAKDLDRLVRKESKESLLLYSKESAVAGLLPKKEEATTVSLTEEEKASDSNLERNTELTGSELITFVYENKSTERMTFQLSVDGNKYPKVTVASKTSLFKQFLGDAKKAQAEAKNAKATEAKAESTEAQTVEASKAEESSAEAKQEVAESKATEATKATEENKASEEARKDDSEVAIVSTAAEAVAESTEAKAEVKTEASEEATEARVEATEAEVKETAAKAETAQAEKATEAQKAVVEDSSLLKDITEHSEEILPELQSIRFTQYSLNELGRKSQNVEIEGFGNVQVFYDEAAFDGDVVLEAKRLFKPDEEVEGEKLSEEQVKILKDEALYDDSASLDIRFVDKKDSATEVEPKSPVAVRITIEKKALPEEAKAEDISIHHIVEEKGTEQPVSVETVSRSDKEKGAESNLEVTATEEKEVKVADSEDKISKEFTVNSFSAYVVHWGDKSKDNAYTRLRFHYVDQAFNEIAPTIHADESWLHTGAEHTLFTWDGVEGKNEIVSYQTIKNKLHKRIYGYGFYGVYAQYTEGTWDKPDDAIHDSQAKVLELTNYSMTVSLNQIQSDHVSRVYYPPTKYTLGENCAYKDIYFMYKVCRNDKVFARDKFLEPSLIHDKYITKYSDDEYELTLTGEVKRGDSEAKPQPVDIVFVYDNTANISEANAKVVKESVNKLIDDISLMKKSYDPRFALVTMDGEDFNSYDPNNIINYDRSRFERDKHNLTQEEKNRLTLEDKIMLLDETIQGHDINGELSAGVVNNRGRKNTQIALKGISNNSLLSAGYEIKDKQKNTLYNDSRNNYAFTSDKDEIKKKINNLVPSSSNQTGANYYAAMRNVQSLVQTWDEGTGTNYLGVFKNKSNFDPKSIKADNSHLVRDEKVIVNGQKRENAKKIVIFIAGGDPTRTYIEHEGVYEDYIKSGDKYYLTRAEYKPGYSIGNGRTIYYPALNNARAVLRNIINIDGFYSVGIGQKSNWSHLDELAMGKVFSDRKKRDPVLANGIDYKLYEGINPEAIKKSFSELTYKIASAEAYNVEITDTLSKYVELIDGNNSIQGKLYKKSGLGALKDTEIEKSDWPSLGLNDIKVTQKNVDGKTVLSLTTVPENYVLKPGYEIRLIAKVKPTADAYKDIAYTSLLKKGEDRTDLNDIYGDDGFEKVDNKGNALNPEKYATSVDKLGLYTNDDATISYKYKKPNDPKPENPTKHYNKPIIKVKEKDTGYLKVYKGFVGFGYKLYDEQKQEWTELGKHVLKNVEFDIKRKLPNGQEELITTVNLGDDRWINGPITTSLQYGLKDGAILKINPVEVEKDDKGNPFFKSVKKDDPTTYHGYRFGFEIDNLPKNTQYQVVERVLNKDTTFTVGAVKYKYQENEEHRRRSSLTEAFNNLPFDVNSDPHGNSYAFNNFYDVTENPNVDLRVKKVVKELGVDAITQEAKDRKFDFYLALYHDVNKNGRNIRMSYSDKELEDVVKGFDKSLIPSEVEVVLVKDIQRQLDGRVDPNAPEADHYAIHFQLKHGQTANFSLKAGVKYRVYEKKDADYDKPEITRLEDGKTIEDSCDVFGNDHVWYTCTDYKKNVGELITYYNPKKLPIPTGIVRDITPYLFGIFGFVAMAGAYLTISKKRREA